MIDRWQFERRAWEQGFSRVGGIDEAGRGPLAGPVIAACVVLPAEPLGLEGLNDSKQLTPRQRQTWFERLKDLAVEIGVGMMDARCIDQQNILQATFSAMRASVQSLAHPAQQYLIDGNQTPQGLQPVECLVQGDQRSYSIAAASVIAKVTRDRVMADYDRLFPAWGFSRHKGYGTEAHLQAIRQHGLSALHRLSFAPNLQLGHGGA